MGLLFPNATFMYFLRLLHSTFISTYITTPHLLPLHITPPHLFPISHANERGVVIFRPTRAAQDWQTGTQYLPLSPESSRIHTTFNIIYDFQVSYLLL